jgi:lipopolysaccharide/colanic/teichoic acid biosynthesis glycosyltransferase
MDSAQSGSIATIEPNDSKKVGLGGGYRDRTRTESVKTASDGHLNGGMNGAAGAAVLRRPSLPGRAPAENLRAPAHGTFAKVAKRAIDLVGSLLLIAILSPLLVVIGLLIKMDSPGPILFRQRRIGRADEPFSMLKFRTMVDGADEQKAMLRHLNEAAEGLFKIDGDPRVTRVGRWLRVTSLDELPQLLHVVTGSMSLVGPRPLVPEEDALITGSNRRRLEMRPGMTGVWQINGASSIPINEMVVLDRGYLEDWSLWLDCRLLLRTAWHVVLRKSL